MKALWQEEKEGWQGEAERGKSRWQGLSGPGKDRGFYLKGRKSQGGDEAGSGKTGFLFET